MITVPAHIAGVPVEETLGFFLPSIGFVYLWIKLKISKCKCGKRGCICGGDE